MLKQLAAVAALSLVAGSAFAVPVDLGNAGDFALLATGYEWNDGIAGGSVGLGSEAHIVGNVGAANSIGLGSSAIVDGNVYHGGHVSKGSLSDVTGPLIHKNPSYWSGLQGDLHNAAVAANASGQNMDRVTGDVTFSANSLGTPSVFNIDSLSLDNGQTLTLSGDSDSQFIINVADGFQLNESDMSNSGGGIILNGVDPDNVLFNILGGAFEVQHGQLAGTFLYADGTFTLGDGLDIAAGSRFLAQGINANLQGATGPNWGDNGGGAGGGGSSSSDPQPVPAPPAFLLLGLALLGMGGLYGRRMSRLRS